MKRVALAIYNRLASPILTKELRGTFRRWLFFTVFTTTLGIAAIVVLIVIFAMYAGGMWHVSADDIGRSIFYGLLITQQILLVLLLPGFCSTFISGERSSQSYDMLIATRLKPWEIIWGKLLASGAYVCTFLLATLPLASLSFLYGGVTPWEIIGSYLFLLATGMLIAVISISISGLFRSIVWSVIVGYLVIMGILSLFQYLTAVSYVSVRGFSPLLFLAGPTGTVHPLFLVFYWLVYAAIFILFFTTAVNRVKPFSANRSTALRIYSTVVTMAVLGFILAIVLTIPSYSGSGSGDEIYRATLTAIGGIGFLFITLYLMMYPVEHNRQSVRVLRRMFRYPAILRPFFPGGRTGMQFTIVSIVVWVGAALAVGLAFGGGVLKDEQRVTIILSALYAALFVISYALIGFWLSTTKLPQWGARLMLFVILLCQTLVPFIAAVIFTISPGHHADHFKNPLLYVSPIGGIHALSDSDYTAWIAVTFGFHLMVIIIFGIIAVGRSRRIRSEQLETVRAMPLPEPSAVTAGVTA